MIKVRILDRCEFCDGEEYIFVCEDVDSRGQTYDRYRPCEMCHGCGDRAKWVSLREFSDLLEQSATFEPDYTALAKELAIIKKDYESQAKYVFLENSHLAEWYYLDNNANLRCFAIGQ